MSCKQITAEQISNVYRQAYADHVHSVLHVGESVPVSIHHAASVKAGEAILDLFTENVPTIQSPAPAPQYDWVMVPREPDENMHRAMHGLYPIPAYRAALAAAPQHMGADPIGWQRHSDTFGWVDMPFEDLEHSRAKGAKVRPIFAHPDSAKEELKELLACALDEWVSSNGVIKDEAEPHWSMGARAALGVKERS